MPIWAIAAKRRRQADVRHGRLGVARRGKQASKRRGRLTSLANPIQRRLATMGRYRLAIVTK